MINGHVQRLVLWQKNLGSRRKILMTGFCFEVCKCRLLFNKVATVWLAAVVLVLPVFGEVLSAQQSELTLADGVYSEEQANRGRKEYRQHCATCHATNLRGGEMAPGLVGQSFISGWSGQTLWSLFDFTLATMPQDNPGSVTSLALNDIMAFILRENGFPGGDESLELDPNSEGERIIIGGE